MKQNLSRRKFIMTGTAAFSGAAAFGYSGLSALGSSFSLARADTLRIGLIGAGSRGSGIAHVLQELPGLSLVACCDITPAPLQKGLSLSAKGAKGYTDYRNMLEDKSTDAVIIATPFTFSNMETGRDAAVAVHMGNRAMREEKYQYWKPAYSLRKADISSKHEPTEATTP